MKGQTFLKATLLMIALSMLAQPVLAQPAATAQRSRGSYLYGDWNLKVKIDQWEMDSILSFSRNEKGERTAHMLNIMGMMEVEDLKYEEGKLSFTQVYRFGDNENKSTFEGKIEEGKLTGTLSSDRGEWQVTGQPAPRVPRIVGSWAMKLKMGEREFDSTLIAKVDKEGELTGEWKSGYGEHEVTEITYERGDVTIKRKSKIGDREWESTFEGKIDWQTDTLSGTIKTERGEITAEGKRIGSEIIGTWNLETTREEREPRKQRLLVNRDLTGLYGSNPIEKVNLEDGKVTFKIVLQFGENKFEMNFAGKIEEGKLTGEMKSERGTSKVTGKKVVRTYRGRPSRTRSEQ